MVGTSYETSDFIVDCIEQWWVSNYERLKQFRQLVINLDNGPQNSSHRTQFMKRLIEFSDKYNLEIVLVYYPPYHSKYNPIERCWGILEQHWNGALLNSVDTVLKWVESMTWKGISPLIQLVDKVYKKGIKLSKQVFKSLNERLERDDLLPKYRVIINPASKSEKVG